METAIFIKQSQMTLVGVISKIRREPVFRYIAVLLMVALNALGQTTTWCTTSNIPISSDKHIPLQLSKLRLRSEKDELSSFVTVKNPKPIRIASLLVIVELLDTSGKHLLSVPFFFDKDSYDSAPKLKFSHMDWVSNHVAEWPGINAKEKRTLASLSPIVSRHCGASARVSWVEIVYDDGSRFERKTNGLILDSMVVKSQPFNMRELQLPMPQTVAGIISLGPTGKFSGVQFLNSGLSAEMESRVKRQIFSNWSISALVDADQLRSITFVLVFSTSSDYVRPTSDDLGSVIATIHNLPDERPVEVLYAIGLPNDDWGWEITCSTCNIGFGKLRRLDVNNSR